jgi:IS1 family transposase/transposase-like protein
MEECPRCKSTNFRKDGIVKEKQRYLCKDCNYHFTVKQHGKSTSMKRNALLLYLEGLGFRSIGRFLDVSHVAVFNWIKGFGEQLETLRSSTEIEVIELDEMHTYIQSYPVKKNDCWIWIAVDRNGKKFIDCQMGSRGSETGKELWKRIADQANGKVCSDDWKAYGTFVPEDQHVISKAETFTIEGYNSLFRHFLARLRRKSKCYTKAKYMLEYSVQLLMAKWNDDLAIIT